MQPPALEERLHSRDEVRLPEDDRAIVTLHAPIAVCEVRRDQPR